MKSDVFKTKKELIKLSKERPLRSVIFSFLIIITIAWIFYGYHWIDMVLIMFIYALFIFILSALLGRFFVKVYNIFREYISGNFSPSSTKQKLFYILLFSIVSFVIATGSRHILGFNLEYKYYLIFSSAIILTGRVIRSIDREISSSYMDGLIDIFLALLFFYVFVELFKPFIAPQQTLINFNEIFSNAYIPFFIGFFVELIESLLIYFKTKKTQSKISYFLSLSYVAAYEKKWEEYKKILELEKTKLLKFTEEYSKLNDKNRVSLDDINKKIKQLTNVIFLKGKIPNSPNIDKSLDSIDVFDKIVSVIGKYFLRDAKEFQIDIDQNITLSAISKRANLHISVLEFDYSILLANLYGDILIHLFNEIIKHPGKLKFEVLLDFLGIYLEKLKYNLKLIDYRIKSCKEGYDMGLKMTDITILVHPSMIPYTLMAFSKIDLIFLKFRAHLLNKKIILIEKTLRDIKTEL